MPLSDAYDYTSKVMTENMLHAEANEGISAFVEKARSKVAGVMKDPVLIALLCGFVLTGVISVYYLVLGLREGRIGRKFNFPYRTQPLSDGRDPGYVLS